jgi:hypothetical protein
MKGKISCIWRVVIALVLASSLGMVMAVPVAANVSTPTVVVTPTTVGVNAQYTIAFITNEDLATSADDDVRIEFPDDTTVPGSYVAADITINGNNAGSNVESVTDTAFGWLITIDVPQDIPHSTVTVVFKLAADIVNPTTAGSYTLKVSTSREVTQVTSSAYNITALVPEGPVDVYNASDVFQASYDTITDALDHAGLAAGWTIRVHSDADGYDSSLETYPIVVDVAGVTIESLDGAASTTIDASGEGNKATLLIDEENVTIGGNDSGFTIVTSGIAGIWVPYGGGDNTGGTGLQILYNDFKAEKQGESHGIWVEAMFQASANQGALIDDNDFSQAGTWSDTGGLGAPGTGIQIAQADYSQSTRNIISNNTAANQKYTWLTFKPEMWAAGEVCMANATTVEGVDVHGNVVHGNRGYGVHFALAKHDIPANSVQSLTIGSYGVKLSRNEFYNNGGGVKIDADIVDAYQQSELDASLSGVDNINICFNDIYNNTNTAWNKATQYGVWNGTTTWVNATRNYWGDLSGPSGVGLGTGDAVSTCVYYEPWLTYPYADVVDESVQWYGGAYYVEVGPGWNTLATPVALDARADQMGEIVALGGWMQNYLIGYSYDPVSGWQLIGSGYQLLPCSAIYVKMSDEDVLPCLKNGDFYIPTKDLPKGFNLVSLNYDDCMLACLALKSIETLSGLGGYSQVISPPLPNQPNFVWTPTVPAIVPVLTPCLSPGWGYWVYMTGDGTLAGFLMTPQYLTSGELDFIACTSWSLDAPEPYIFPWDCSWEWWPEWY